ncbi:ribosome small subunit-dependent GTPase A [Sutcliffiella horikoshii]|uniref:Small ribosomal subunit biogenesis GTPase RsgA n=1 Tax=Sutcliffiella horikoshii TaxID=79883 RepID=A0AA94WRJ6_9BACI|nr:ribosome small subunit-dependent GTPase A [Sutcliffiella horikoshii]TYS61313.1 ribosome small subunit-dependent GTPase A [Sutcliffiella horikoshii]
MKRNQLGWNEFLNSAFTEYEVQGYTVGRVMLEHKRLYRVETDHGECLAEVAGKYRFEAVTREDYPAVGDWVVLSERQEEGKATIHALLPRFSKFSRKAAGLTTEEQIVAANVDTVFLVQSLNYDFNPRRLERYLVMAWESGSNPVVVLTKSDLCEDIPEKIAEMEAVAFGVPIHAVSVKDETGLEELASYFTVGKTVALLGSSGAGKSTLTNYLLGEEKQLIQEVRSDDDKGKHTTTYRELYMLPTGGLVLDTPGMRELQLWEADGAISHSFQDIEELAEQCYFRDCKHGNEPKCAVQGAINEGTLDAGRYQSYVKLQRELAFLERKNDKRAQLAEKEKWKKITSGVRGGKKK